ncbi:GNAT family N-acetyltransferase [Streptomyces scopuliridis]|uniref:GNAT family N-acetyltransferase n=1 Tax=Streptomyces scopuliridis TaxID=452529 RepID=UPI00369E05C1
MYPISRRSERLEVRELQTADADDVFAIYGDERATEHLSFDPRTRDEVAQIIARSMASATANPRQEYVLAITQRETGRLIGFGRLTLDPHQTRAATMGFALRPDAWGTGYGSETVRLLLDVGFAELDLHRVWGSPLPHQRGVRANHASGRDGRRGPHPRAHQEAGPVAGLHRPRHPRPRMVGEQLAFTKNRSAYRSRVTLAPLPRAREKRSPFY